MYQFCAGAMAMGVGVGERSRRAKPEARTTSRHCTSQSRVDNVDDCILSALINTPYTAKTPKGPTGLRRPA